MNNLNALSNDQLVEIAPSVGATRPHPKASDKYSFIPTLDAVNILREDGWLPTSVQEVGSTGHMTGYQKHLVRLSRPDLVVNGHMMDMCLFNSHDTGSAYKIIGGVVKFACANSLVSGDLMAEYTHKHIGFDPQMFLESARRISGYLEKTAGVIEDWRAIELTPDERGVFAQSALGLVHETPADAPIQPRQLLNPRRREDYGSDLWTTFNVLQENLIKGGVRGVNANLKRMTTRPVKSIDRDRKLNQSLWMLTEKMAELKKA
jgi:hypothetical protein